MDELFSVENPLPETASDSVNGILYIGHCSFHLNLMFPYSKHVAFEPTNAFLLALINIIVLKLNLTAYVHTFAVFLIFGLIALWNIECRCLQSVSNSLVSNWKGVF